MLATKNWVHQQFIKERIWNKDPGIDQLNSITIADLRRRVYRQEAIVGLLLERLKLHVESVNPELKLVDSD